MRHFKQNVVQLKKKSIVEFRKYLEPNNNTNTIYQILEGQADMAFRVKSWALH